MPMSWRMRIGTTMPTDLVNNGPVHRTLQSSRNRDVETSWKYCELTDFTVPL